MNQYTINQWRAWMIAKLGKEQPSSFGDANARSCINELCDLAIIGQRKTRRREDAAAKIAASMLRELADRLER